MHRYPLFIVLSWIAISGMLCHLPVMEAGMAASRSCRCEEVKEEGAKGGCCCQCGEHCQCHLQQKKRPQKFPAELPVRDSIRPLFAAIHPLADAKVDQNRGTDSFTERAGSLHAPSSRISCILLSRFLL